MPFTNVLNVYTDMSLSKGHFDLFSIFFSMFYLSILCLFSIFAFLCFVVLCFVIDPVDRHKFIKEKTTASVNINKLLNLRFSHSCVVQIATIYYNIINFMSCF